MKASGPTSHSTAGAPAYWRVTFDDPPIDTITTTTVTELVELIERGNA